MLGTAIIRVIRRGRRVWAIGVAWVVSSSLACELSPVRPASFTILCEALTAGCLAFRAWQIAHTRGT